jgi:ABC-type Mn2+/Zn2+ transport system permease subunit
VIEWLTEPLGEPIAQRAIAELALIGLLSGALGCWLVLAGRSYSAESLAHSMLPGLVVAALLGLPLVAGGAAGLVVGALLIALAARIPRLDQDAAVAVVVTSLLGLGVLLGLAPDVPAGLGELLFGDVLAVTGTDLALTAGVAALVLAVLAALHPRLLAAGFDRLNARALGSSPALTDAVLALLLAAATLVAVRALGNLLVVAMLVGPAATARVLAHRMPSMMAIATGVAIAASVAGVLVSYHARTATGATVTLVLVGAFALSLAWRRVALAARGAQAAQHDLVP